MSMIGTVLMMRNPYLNERPERGKMAMNHLSKSVQMSSSVKATPVSMTVHSPGFSS